MDFGRSMHYFREQEITDSPPERPQEHINPYKPSVFFCGTKAHCTDPDQTLQNAASDQILH